MKIIKSKKEVKIFIESIKNGNVVIPSEPAFCSSKFQHNEVKYLGGDNFSIYSWGQNRRDQGETNYNKKQLENFIRENRKYINNYIRDDFDFRSF